MTIVPLAVGRHRGAGKAEVRPRQVGSPVESLGNGRPRRRNPLRILVSGLLSVALAATLLLFLLLAVGPHVVGYRTMTMLTGSMEPGISPGDVVLSVAVPTSEVQVGDVITYHIPVEDRRVETHRVTEVLRGPGDAVAVRTQGDGNANVDPWTATLEGDTVWVERAVVPGLGTVIQVLRSPVVQHGVLWVALAGLLLVGLATIWCRDDRPSPR